MNTCWEDILLHTPDEYWEERDRWQSNQDQLVFINRGNLQANYQHLREMCQHLREQSAYLVTLVATDERHLEDGCFKLYYVFSHKDLDHFLILTYPLREHALPDYQLSENQLSGYLSSGRCYPSIRDIFVAAASFEREIMTLFGLFAVWIDSSPTSLTSFVSPTAALSETSPDNFLLHDAYPPHLNPMEAGKRIEELIKEIERKRNGRHVAPIEHMYGEEKIENILTVGPIHAGIIEAGRFTFYIAGETVDDVQIQLGFKHKGIEKLFQTKFSMLDGWQLAERISGDSSFSHSLAYCHAVEALANIEIPPQATWLRGLLLELERLYNHIGDSAALAHDVAFDLAASEIAVLREYLVRLNAELTGHRLLRGMNRPGGIMFPLHQKEVLNQAYIDTLIEKVSRNRFRTLEDLIAEFYELGELLIRTPAFRERAINTGNLKEAQARILGATGLIARASGMVERDFRVNHPSGIYKHEPELLRLIDLRAHFAENEGLNRPHTSGDVFSRLDMRLHEVTTSSRVIRHMLEKLEICPDDELIEPHTEEAIRAARNFEFALGYVEGWRGDIVYWLMKDRFNKIFRCKVRDPSFLNWPALRVAVIPDDKTQADTTGNILPDFPVTNKSFNLAYSGHDL